MKRLLLAMIRFYRRYISPNKPPCCRYIPTCSQYAIEAIEKYGAIKGGWLRGAAGGAVLMAELLCAEGYMDR